ncbi:MAG: hypothetical protein HYZ18_03820 [Pseudogulbenkiania sp.]|nr:hypothetical protein [Pseudogulbenkiania sp.]
MATSKKQVIPYGELLEKVQGVIASYPKGCRNIHVDSLQVHAESIDGANWHVATYRRSGDDNDLTECRARIASDLRLLRLAYDVQVND